MAHVAHFVEITFAVAKFGDKRQKVQAVALIDIVEDIVVRMDRVPVRLVVELESVQRKKKKARGD